MVELRSSIERNSTIAEEPTAPYAAVVARLRQDGHLDRSFSGDGTSILRKTSTSGPALRDAVMQESGKILLTGIPGASSSKAYVARLKNRGRPFVAP